MGLVDIEDVDIILEDSVDKAPEFRISPGGGQVHSELGRTTNTSSILHVNVRSAIRRAEIASHNLGDLYSVVPVLSVVCVCFSGISIAARKSIDCVP